MTGQAEAQAAPLNELQLAEEVAAGRLPSGFPCAGYRLWALRISGTGPAARPAHKEVAIRDAGTWLSPEMIERCRGLPVVIEHPPSGQLDGDSFAQRAVGVVMLAYPRNGELWCVAKVFDADANAALEAGACSTSPSASFAAGDGGQAVELGDGKRLHLEGVPFRVDHLALVPNGQGVWDRGVPGRGVRCDSNQHGENQLSETMMDAAPPDAVMVALTKLTDCLTGLASKQEAMAGRLDTMCARMDGIEATAAAAQPKTVETIGLPTPTAADSVGSGRLTLEQERERNSQLAQAQLRADRACVAFGERAPPPMQGETPLAYRKRLLRPYKKYSPDYEKIDVDAVNDAAMFNVIETRVFADAISASERGDHLPGDQLVPVTTTDSAGRRVTIWRGRKTFIHHMKPTTKRAKLIRPGFIDNQTA